MKTKRSRTKREGVVTCGDEEIENEERGSGNMSVKLVKVK